MSKIDDLLAKLKDVEPEYREIEVSLAGELVTLRFLVIPGTEWAELTAANPFRPGVLVDANYGYNLHAVVKQSAPKWGRVVDGDDVMELPEEQWTELFDALSGHDFSAVTDAVWGLNEWQPGQLVERLKKAQTRARGKKQS